MDKSKFHASKTTNSMVNQLNNNQTNDEMFESLRSKVYDSIPSSLHTLFSNPQNHQFPGSSTMPPVNICLLQDCYSIFFSVL